MPTIYEATFYHAVSILRSIIAIGINTVLIKEPRISMAKCLSIRQPYADLIVSGRKTIELRKWNARFRGEFLVHAHLS